MEDKIVYLAGPIEGVDKVPEIRTRIKYALARMCTVFDPWAAWSQGAGTTAGRRITKINRQVIELSDFVVAVFGTHGRGFGTAREIEMARQLGKPVIVVYHPKAPVQSLECGDLFMLSTDDERLAPTLFLDFVAGCL